MRWYIHRTTRRERLARKLQTVAKNKMKKRKKRVFVRGGDITVVAIRKKKQIAYEVHGRSYKKRRRDDEYKKWEEEDISLLEMMV